MKTFADLNINVEHDFYVCAKMSIDDLLNQKVVVLGAKRVSRHGWAKTAICFI